jgi:hypothetical protein
MATVLAFWTKSIDLNHRMGGRETQTGRRTDNGAINSGIIQLGNRLTTGTDEELTAVFSTRMGAAYIGIETLNTVYQTKLQ